MVCAICFDSDSDDNWIHCSNHVFHEECLLSWVISRPNDILNYRGIGVATEIPCPLCEKDLLNKLPLKTILLEGAVDLSFFSSSLFTDHIKLYPSLYKWMFPAAIAFAAQFNNWTAFQELLKLEYPHEDYQAFVIANDSTESDEASKALFRFLLTNKEHCQIYKLIGSWYRAVYPKSKKDYFKDRVYQIIFRVLSEGIDDDFGFFFVKERGPFLPKYWLAYYAISIYERSPIGDIHSISKVIDVEITNSVVVLYLSSPHTFRFGTTGWVRLLLPAIIARRDLVTFHWFLLNNVSILQWLIRLSLRNFIKMKSKEGLTATLEFCHMYINNQVKLPRGEWVRLAKRHHFREAIVELESSNMIKKSHRSRLLSTIRSILFKNKPCQAT